MKLNERIRAARESRPEGWTQQEAAEYFGVEQPTYAQWESGRRPPGRSHLPKLYLFLGKPNIHEFLELVAEAIPED